MNQRLAFMHTLLHNWYIHLHSYHNTSKYDHNASTKKVIGTLTLVTHLVRGIQSALLVHLWFISPEQRIFEVSYWVAYARKKILKDLL